MQFVQFDRRKHRRQRWQRFWPRFWLVFLALIELLVTGAVIGLEIWSMIINIKYSFFFIGFIASFFFLLTSISTLTVVSCCRKSLGCATYAFIQHILSIAASVVLLYYDIRFVRHPNTCLWPNYLCNEDLSYFNLSNITFGTNTDVSWIKFTLLKVQIACAAVMIMTCLVYIVIYIYTSIRIYQNNTVTDPHTIIELGRMPPPPPPLWPDPPRDLPPSSEF